MTLEAEVNGADLTWLQDGLGFFQGVYHKTFLPFFTQQKMAVRVWV